MIAAELIKIREEKKLSKSEFAALLGIAPMLLGRYEKGSLAIPDSVAEKVAALGAVKVAADVVEKKAATKKKASPVKKAVKVAATKVAVDVAKDAAKKAAVDVAEQAVKGVAKKAGRKVAKDAAKAVVAAGVVDAAVKTAKKKEEKAALAFIIQSLLGESITPEEVLKKVPADVDTVYVKPGENKAYWVKGDETGSVNLW